MFKQPLTRGLTDATDPQSRSTFEVTVLARKLAKQTSLLMRIVLPNEAIPDTDDPPKTRPMWSLKWHVGSYCQGIRSDLELIAARGCGFRH